MGNHINVPPVGAHVDDSYMYQLSLVVATATVSYSVRISSRLKLTADG